MSVRVLEHVVRRAPLALRLTDLATGKPVVDGTTVTAWPAAHPERAVVAAPTTAAGIAGFATLPGTQAYEDGSTARADWFDSPITNPPLAYVLRVEDTTGDHLPVVREVLVPSAQPVAVALPRSPSAPVPSGSLAAVATVVTQSGDPASWAVVEVRVGTLVTGSVADERGVVVIPIPRAVAPTGTGSPATGPTWSAVVRVRLRPADQVPAPGARPTDPPPLPALLTQPFALVVDGAGLVGSITRTLTTAGPVVLASNPPPAPSVVVVRPAP